MTYEIKQANRLPTSVNDDNRIVQAGFAVEAGRDSWFFFTDAAPAYAFARAGRMSFQINWLEWRRAAFESHFDIDLGSDRKVLWLGQRMEGDDSLLSEFVNGVSANSSSWAGGASC